MMDELSQYRSRVLCSTVEPPPIGRLPVIDPADAQNLAAYPQWHAYIQRVESWFFHTIGSHTLRQRKHITEGPAVDARGRTAAVVLDDLGAVRVVRAVVGRELRKAAARGHRCDAEHSAGANASHLKRRTRRKTAAAIASASADILC